VIRAPVVSQRARSKQIPSHCRDADKTGVRYLFFDNTGADQAEIWFPGERRW
jgi:hypothetical protein